MTGRFAPIAVIGCFLRGARQLVTSLYDLSGKRLLARNAIMILSA
jgi:hypothetical protein